jgi:uncharacterized protein (TIGR03067 family)
MPRRLTLLVALTAGTMVLAADPAKKKDGDLAKLAGTWKTLTGPDKDVPLTLKIEGQMAVFRLESPDGKDSFLFSCELRLDEAAIPKRVDLFNPKLQDGTDMKLPFDEGGEKKSLGIYALDGDELRVCMGGRGEERPKEFKSRDPNDGPPALFVFKREPAAAK